MKQLRRLTSRLFGSLTLLSLVFVGGTSCDDLDTSSSDDDDNDAQAEKPEKAEEKTEEAAKPGEEKKDEAEEERLAYSYNPIGKRDPFKSFITQEVAPGEVKIETPLQKFEIDQYKLVAIIWGADEPVAMVEDPEKMGYMLQRETIIGKNWGKVVRITPTEVIVAEEYRDFEGKLIVNEIPLRLPPEKEEAR
jgi:type IV pilus assembly protein PilP